MPYISYLPARQAELNAKLSRWVSSVCFEIKRSASKKAPRATGEMGRKIIVLLLGLIGYVTADSPYAKFVEGFHGATRRHFHSWNRDYQFRAWARRKGFDTSKDGGLMVWGYRMPFFSEGVKSGIILGLALAKRLKI